MFKLPIFGKKEGFPDQFFALDLGGKVLKVFLLQSSEGVTQALGSRKVTRRSKEEDLKNFKEAVAELRRDFPDAVPVAVVGVSGPSTLAFTTVVRSSLSRDVEELVSHARTAALESAKNELRYSFGEPKLEASELEAEILEVKEAEKLEVYLFTSFAANEYLEQQEEFVREAGLSLKAFTSLPFNLVGELSTGLSAQDFNALMIDVGGAKTELSLAFGGQLMETKSFFWEFTENVDPNVFLDLWLFSVDKALKAFEGVEAFPEKIYLAGGAAAFPGLSEAVSSYPWSREHPFEIAPEVVVLGDDQLPLSLGQVARRLKEDNQVTG